MSRHDPLKLEAANLEATNAIGITSLLEPQKIREDVDLEAVEAKVVGRRVQEGVRPIDEARAYDREIWLSRRVSAASPRLPAAEPLRHRFRVELRVPSWSSRSRSSRGSRPAPATQDYHDSVRLRLRPDGVRTEASVIPDKSIGSGRLHPQRRQPRPRQSRQRPATRRPPRHGGEVAASARAR